ncbi:transglutaminase TgpA family protein [Paenibacillus herberti]|nr:transglutaminaseTgpA domain-containing protein [Paenibacillus herberti]
MLEANRMQTRAGLFSRGGQQTPRARWFLALSSVLTAVMIASTVSVLEQLWWEETFVIVYTVLAVVALLDLIPVGRIYGLFAQLIAVLLILVQLSPIQFGSIGPVLRYMTEGGLVAVSEVAKQFSPFLEISLAVWVIYAMFATWTRLRIRIIGFTTVNLLVLAISDSFTPIYLWDSVAIVVFAGLVWLIAEHYASFQQQHPLSWKRLLRYPLQLMLPIVLVLSLVMTTGLIAPEIPPVIKDPYTAWKESQGQQVQSFVGDKGIAPDSSGKSAKSGYSRNDDNLGGGFNFDYSPVMEVTSSQKSYWRGETKDYYNGSGWTSSEELQDNIISMPTDGTDIGGMPLSPNAETVEIKQSFKMLRKDKFPVLFGAPTARSIEIPNNGRISYEDIVNFDVKISKLGIALNGNTPYPPAYTVVSEQVVLNDALKEASAAPLNSMPFLYYGQVPLNSQSRVAGLAREITADAVTDFDKAKAIETYLSSNFTYTNEPDLSKKRSKDFVDSFLFEIKEGYCDYFSTAMAVMARHVDLPSRWVKGYAPGSGTVNREDLMRQGATMEDLSEMNGEDTYTVRNSDAHSWVEIYFEGFGWVPFEPTPGFAFPYATAAGSTAPEPSVEPLPSTAPEVVEDTAAEENSFNLPAWLGWVGLTVLTAAAGVLAFNRREQLAGLWSTYRTRSLTAEQRVVWETERLIRSARRHGLTKAEHETLREAIFRWSEQRRFLKQEFSDLLKFFERAKYGGKSVTMEEAAVYSDNIRALRGRLRPPS